MRILHFVLGMSIGGTETMLVSIANRQCKFHSVAILVLNDLVDISLIGMLDASIKVIYVNRKLGSRNPVDLLMCNYYVMTCKPDIIHCHWDIGHLILPFWGKVRTIHNTRSAIKYPKIWQKFFAVSDSVRNYVLEHNIIPENKICTVPNGINSSLLQRKQEFDCSDRFRICQIGRLEHNQKGQDILLRTMCLLVHDRGVRCVTVDFIGDGPSEEYLKRLAVELGIDEYVNFLGNQPNTYLYDNLKNYHLLIQPSRYEGFGLTVLEAMAARVPVVVSDVEGPMEVIQGGKYGDYFQSEDLLNCAQSILNVIKQYGSPYFLERLDAACDYAVKTFDVRNTADMYLREYSEVLHAKAPC